MIRRRKTMRFMGGYYAFPGGKLDPADATAEALARCRGLAPLAAARLVPALDGVEPLAFWISAARELLEEVGVLLAVAEDGGAIDVREADVGARVERMRRALLADAAPFAALLAAEGGISISAPSATSPTSSRRRRVRSASPRASSSPRCRSDRTRCTVTRRRPRGSGSIRSRAISASGGVRCPWPIRRNPHSGISPGSRASTRSGPLMPTAGTSSTGSSTASRILRGRPLRARPDGGQRRRRLRRSADRRGPGR